MLALESIQLMSLPSKAHHLLMTREERVEPKCVRLSDDIKEAKEKISTANMDDEVWRERAILCLPSNISSQIACARLQPMLTKYI